MCSKAIWPTSRFFIPIVGSAPPGHPFGTESTRKGHPIISADAWIAASAIVLSVPLVTNNPKDYRHLDKLKLISAAPL